MSELLLVRDKYTPQTTVGKLYIGGEYFSETLEDTVRATGIKVIHHTAIPSGRYRITVTRSNRFKRDMILIYNQKDLSLINNGIRFTGIRIHGGNTHLNTSGCVLVAKNRVNDYTIQGTQEKALTKKVKELLELGEVYLTITNNNQAR